ncbi:MAG: hypothetical protein K5838_02680 [Elusimicrobiales bacterium]|nr:hypothetical protein [Elusimicrobiales bacterium]
MRKPKREIILEFEKMAGEGKALGHSEGKVIFCYGALPGETARVITSYEKKNFAEAELLEIIKPSPKRINPKEEHYMCCSPWQTIEYSCQAELKRQLIEEAFMQSMRAPVKIDKFYKAENLFGYRTKIEYSFIGEPGKISLAFHKRGNWKQRIPLEDGCILAGSKTNAAAKAILRIINQKGLSCEDLKTLIIRETKNTDECVASLFITREDIDFPLPEQNSLNGFILVYSDPKISSSVTTKVLKQTGTDYLTEQILGKKISFGFDCFFQNNIPLFTEALKEMQNSMFPCRKFTDLYSGVGVIGLSIGSCADSLLSVEAAPASAKFAEMNARQNGISNFRHICSMTEKTDAEQLKGTDILAVDPPRSGLHPKAMNHIMEIQPKRIIYLSCNPITQGRDAAILLEKYNLMRCAGFDFYPNTPHAESLMIFDRKAE